MYNVQNVTLMLKIISYLLHQYFSNYNSFYNLPQRITLTSLRWPKNKNKSKWVIYKLCTKIVYNNTEFKIKRADVGPYLKEFLIGSNRKHSFCHLILKLQKNF